VIFAVSFLWDFPGMSIHLWGHAVALDGLLRILSVSGLIGFLTNWLAVTMLFQPRERHPLFGQGLIPAQRERVVARLAEVVSQRLINEQLIHQQIHKSGLIPRARQMVVQVVRDTAEDPDFRADLRHIVVASVKNALAEPGIRRQLSDFIYRQLTEQTQGVSGIIFRLLQQFRGQELVAHIEAALDAVPNSVDQALDRWHPFWDKLPGKLEAWSDDIEHLVSQGVLHFVQQLDVHSLIIDNMNKFDEAQLESLLKHASNEQFNYIKYLGGVLGVIGGLVIWQPAPALLLFGIIGLSLWLVDTALMQRRKR
jgi:uncharacterized membrane protein YheB (UPF0754 family)